MMKNIRLLAVCFLLAAFALFALSACTPPEEPKEPAQIRVFEDGNTSVVRNRLME